MERSTSMAAAWRGRKRSISSASWQASQAAWNIGKTRAFGVGRMRAGLGWKSRFSAASAGRWPVRLATTSSGVERRPGNRHGETRSAARRHRRERHRPPQTPVRVDQPRHRSDYRPARRSRRRSTHLPRYGGAAAPCAVVSSVTCASVRGMRCARLIATSPGRHRDRALPEVVAMSLGTSGAPGAGTRVTAATTRPRP